MTTTNKILSVIKCISLITLLFLSQKINSQTRHERAADFFNKESKLKSSTISDVKLTVKYESSQAEESVITVFQNKEVGFVLIAGDDKSNFVIGYSDGGEFDYENASDGLKALIAQYETKGIENNSSLLKSGNIYPAISPLLDSRGVSLNQFYHSEVGGSPSGCVVTAFTQIMLFHQFPNYGIGSHCYTNPKYGQFCADYGNTFLDWENMTTADYKQLSFDVGTAMEMSYHLSGSVPTTSNYEYALEEFYGYHIYKGSSNFDDIYYELECNRPVYVAIAGEGDSPGHAVVVDGVDSNGYYHLNFGWDGRDNGYFLIPGKAIQDHGGRVYGGYFNSVVNVSTTPFDFDKNDIEALKAIAGGLSEYFYWDLSEKVTRWPGIYFNRGRVKGLNLGQRIEPYQLFATLTDAIEDLTELESFVINAKIEGININTFTKLANLKKLSIKNYMDNDVKCNFPEEFGNLTKLQELEFQHLLQGEMPTSITNLSNLEVLKLNNNYLTGTLPENIGNLSKLKELEIGYNQLGGSIPESIGNLNLLESLDLRENNLTGNIPTSIGNLTELENFHLNSNQLNGPLPDEVGNFTKTYSFDVSNNQLEGAVPATIGNLEKVSWFSFSLANNQFTSLPDEIANLDIKELKVNGNKLTTLPASIFSVGNIESINASNNEITTLPENFGAKSRIGNIDLSHNKLTEFPLKLCFVSFFRNISVSHNMLTSLPDAFENLGKIPKTNDNFYNSIDISNNQISGKLPASIVDGSIREVDFSKNKFIFGDMPEDYSEDSFIFSGTQAFAETNDSAIKVFPNRETIIDIREISRLHHPKNRYFWFEYPEMKKDRLYKGDYSNDSPYLTINMQKGEEDKFYYCRIINHDVPFINYLDSEVIRITVMDEQEQLTSLYPESHLLFSDDVHIKEVKNNNITFVSPYEKRGDIIWQISTDNKTWKNLSKQMDETELYENVFSMTKDELVIEPKLTAWYRCVLQEASCDPLISKAIKASPYQEELLFSEVINAQTESFIVEVDSIEVKIPQGFSENSFKLSISKVHDAPPAPDGYELSTVYDVSVDFDKEFDDVIEISLKNINIDKIDIDEIPEIKPVYYDEKLRQWIEYEYGGVSLNDKVFFKTNHLTKLAWYKRLEEKMYGRMFSNDKVVVFYKYVKDGEEDNRYDRYSVANYHRMPTKPWHNANIDPDNGGAPFYIQDVAHFMKDIITKIEGQNINLGLVKYGKFAVFVGDTGGLIKDYTGHGEAYGYISSSGYSEGFFYLNTRKVDTTPDMMTTLAHEFMHYTQSKFFNVSSNNYFFAEAHAPLADRFIWNETELEKAEPEVNLMSARTESEVSQSIYDLLSKSWDSGSVPIGTLVERFIVNSADANISSSFLHYMRSYSGINFDPIKVIKADIFDKISSFAWRSYLDDYLRTNHLTKLGTEYDKFVKYIFSGENKNFTILDEHGNPYSYLLNNVKKNNKGTYVDRFIWNFIDEEDKNFEKENLQYSVPYLGSKVLFFQNNTTDKPVVVSYKRNSEVTDDDVVYNCYYNYEDKKVVFEDITAKENFALLLDNNSALNEDRYTTCAFLLFVNKRCPSIVSIDRNFNIDFEITATPVTNIQDIALVNVGNDAIHTFDDGSKGAYVISGKMNYTTFTQFQRYRQYDYDSYKYMVDEHTIVIETQFKDSWEVASGSYLPKSLNNRDIKQTVFYNFVTGDLNIIQKTIHNQSWSAYSDYAGKEYDGYLHTVYSTDQQLELSDVQLFEEAKYDPLYGNHYSFETTGSEHTEAIIKNISEVTTTIRYNSNGEVGEEKTQTLVSSDYSSGNQRIVIKIHK